MNYPAASYGVSKAPIRNRLFAARCGELTRMRLKGQVPELHLIGDAKTEESPSIFGAVSDGSEIARVI
jgi:hypothetical protein